MRVSPVPGCRCAPFLPGHVPFQEAMAQFKEAIPIQGPAVVSLGRFSDENVTSRVLKSAKRGHEAGTHCT